MVTNLSELRIRLEVHFEEADHDFNVEDGRAPHPLPYALLTAIDLVEEIQRHLARDDADKITLQAVVRAWQQRAVDGRPKPRVVKEENEQ
jgi:hypothetical protein